MINHVLCTVIYYLEAAIKRPLWIVGPAVATVVIGAAVVFNLPQTYSSEAQLLVEAPQTQGALVRSTVANEHLQFVEQRVLARDKLIELAERLNLFPGKRQTMSETRFGQLVRQQIAITINAAEQSERYSGTSAVHIAFTASTAAQASEGASELVRMIIEENRGLRIQRSSELSEFLNREVTDLSARLKVRETDWDHYLRDNADALPGRATGLDQDVQEKDRELTELDQSIASLDLELRLQEAELRLGMQRPEASARDEVQLAELKSDLAAKSLTYSPAHPEIKALTQRLNGLQSKIAAESAVAKPARAQTMSRDLALVAERIDIAKFRYASLTEKRGKVSEQLAALRTTVARAPAVRAQVELIQRERQTLQNDLDEMRGKLATARTGERLERESSTANVQIIERPETPRYPSSPSRTRAMLLVLGAAICMGAAGLYLADSISGTIRGTFDLVGPLAGSTLVVVPRWSCPTAHRSVAERAFGSLAGLVRGNRSADA